MRLTCSHMTESGGGQAASEKMSEKALTVWENMEASSSQPVHCDFLGVN